MCLSKYGKITNCILKKQGKCKNSYAFVTYATAKEADCASLAGSQRLIRLNGQYLRILPAASWHQPLKKENCCEEDNSSYNEPIITWNYNLEDKKNISSLNDDCLMIIFNYLPIIDRVSVERVCRRWQLVSKESWIFHKKLDMDPLKWGLRPFYCINAPYLIQVVNRCGSYLTHVNLSESKKLRCHIGNMTLIKLSQLCPNLNSINIEGITVQASGLRALAKYCCHIENLTISFEEDSCLNTKETFLFFSKLRKLSNLKIINKKLDSNTVLLGLHTKTITNLILTNFDSVDLLFGETIPKMSNLKVLQLREIKYYITRELPLSQDQFSYPVLKKCEVFEMSVRNGWSLNSHSLTEKMQILANFFCNLRKIKIAGIEFINDNFFNTLTRNNRHISIAYISSCSQITNKGLAHITSMPSLEHLIIDNLKEVTDEIFVDMPNLKSLYCFNCEKISNDGLIKLVTLSQNINLINLSGCSLVNNKFIYAALKAAECRKNNNILELYVGRTSVNMNMFTKISGLLRIERDLLDLSRAKSIHKINKLFFNL